MKGAMHHELPVIPTANLVDIAILLIIFYMACSHFVAQSVKIAPPQAEDLASQKEPMIVVSIDDTNTIRLQGVPVAGAQDVEAGVGALTYEKKTEEGRTVMFKCDSSVRRDVFAPVLNAIVKGGGLVLAAGDNRAKPVAAKAKP